MSNKYAGFSARCLQLITAAVAITVCQQPTESTRADDAFSVAPIKADAETMTMQITSTAFDAGKSIPEKYTGVGEDISPPLAWADVPEGTVSLAIICDDPDAPTRAKPRPEGPWVHWCIYNIPADVSKLPEAVPRKAELEQPEGARQGTNDFPKDNVGYRGPMPPKGSGPHRYRYTIYALDRELDMPPKDADKKSLLRAMKDHVLGEGQLVGIFERS